MQTALHPRPAPVRGLTLIELLVALALLSVLALLSWRTLDGMTRTQAVAQEHADRWRNWQTALAQWDADLDAVLDTERVPPLDFDGSVLRLTRSDPDRTGRLRVAGWSLQTDPATGQLRWARWLSAPLASQGELEQAWQQAANWSRNPGAQDRLQQVLLTPVAGWQLFYHRGGAWTNPQSAADEDSEQGQPAPARLPDGVRLLLTLPDGSSPSGQLQRDWVRPTLGGERS
jgi:general secretion pathway protein J